MSNSVEQAHKLLVIVGPTASGKSALAMQVAQRHNGEIICADSRTVYKGMDIGTAKPSEADRERVPHYLLDLVRPDEKFSAADFRLRAEHAIDYINGKGKLPIMVGGTGLYVDSVIFDYQFGSPSDLARRIELEAKSVEELQEICRLNDIEIPINSKNKRHLIRAIELGGLPHRNGQLRHNTLVVGIATEKEKLRERIEQRAHAMLKEGIVDEVKSLSERYGWGSEAMTGNIYRIFKDVVAGDKTETQAIEEFVRSDMSLVKRQLTWFKRNPAIHWGSSEQLMGLIDDFVKGIRRTP